MAGTAPITWTDQISGSDVLGQISSDSTPITGAATVNGRNVFTFDGTLRRIGNADLGHPAGWTHAFLYRAPNPLATATLWDSYTNTPATARYVCSVLNTGVIQTLIGGALDQSSAGAIVAGGYYLFVQVCPASGTSTQLYVNNMDTPLRTPAQVSGGMVFDDYMIGSAYTGANPWAATSELLGSWVFSGTTLDRAALLAYVQHTWGILT